MCCLNGDEDANKQMDKNAEILKAKRAEFERLLTSFDDLKAEPREIERFKELPGEIHDLERGSNNTLIVTLLHPGEDGNVKVLKSLSIGNGQERGFKAESDDFLDVGLFKKIAMGEFGIQVAITDTDEANPFSLFFRRVLSGVFNAVVKSPIDNIGNVIVSSTASELSNDIQAAIKGKKGDKITVVGVSPVAKFIVGSNGALALANAGSGIRYVRGKLTLNLRFPELVKTKDGYAKPRSSNGGVVIRLDSEFIQ